MRLPNYLLVSVWFLYSDIVDVRTIGTGPTRLTISIGGIIFRQLLSILVDVEAYGNPPGRSF